MRRILCAQTSNQHSTQYTITTASFSELQTVSCLLQASLIAISVLYIIQLPLVTTDLLLVPLDLVLKVSDGVLVAVYLFLVMLGLLFLQLAHLGCFLEAEEKVCEACPENLFAFEWDPSVVATILGMKLCPL